MNFNIFHLLHVYPQSMTSEGKVRCECLDFQFTYDHE